MLQGDLDLRFALAAGAGALAMVVYLLALILLARAFEVTNRIRRSKFVDNWNEVLSGARPVVPASIARLRPRDRRDMVERWNAVFADVRESDADARRRDADLRRLRRIGDATGLVEASFLMLRQPGRDEHVAAVTCLGYMRALSAWNDLVPLVRDPDPYVSLSALLALVRIDELDAAPFLTRHFGAHPDWPEHAVATLIDEVSEATRETLILYALHGTPIETRARIFAGLEQVGHSGAARLLDDVVAEGTSVDDLTRFLYAARLEGHVQRLSAEIREGRERARAHAVSLFSSVPGVADRWESEPPWVRALAVSHLAASDESPAFR